MAIALPKRKRALAAKTAGGPVSGVDTGDQLTVLEREFLTPLLEIQETPPSPVKRRVLISIVSLIVVLVVWSYFGELEIVASAPGKFIPDGKVKVIQPIDTSVVRAIHVADGQPVRKGDLLLELDPTINAADLTANKKRLAIIKEEVASARPLVEMGAMSRRDLAQLEQDLASLTAEVAKAQQRYDLQWLRAPVDGMVQSVSVATLGAVVTPAQPLVTIVPRETSLVVEAKLSNEDVGFVKIGQSSEIKVDTFPFQKYGTLRGKVIWVSPDAEDAGGDIVLPGNASDQSAFRDQDANSSNKTANINNKVSGLVYRVHIQPEQLFMMVDGRQVPLTPGMTVKADITTDHRTVLQFFLSPAIRYLDEGLKVR